MSRHAASTRRSTVVKRAVKIDRSDDDTVPLPVVPTHRASVAAPIDGQRARLSGPALQVRVLTVRSLRTVFGDVRLVFFGLLQPVIMLLLFSQVFQSVGALPSLAAYHGYINFLMPATLVNIAMTTAMSSGAGLIAEIYNGFVGRLRTMPITLFSVLLARTLADAVRLSAQLVVTLLAAVIFLRFRPAGFVGAAEALALTVLAGWGLSWVFIAIATWQRTLATMQAVSFIVMFPLMFASSAYMPLTAMPMWLRLVAMANPLTYAIDAARALTLGQAAGPALFAEIGLIVLTALIGGGAAARNFRRSP